MQVGEDRDDHFAAATDFSSIRRSRRDIPAVSLLHHDVAVP